MIYVNLNLFPRQTTLKSYSGIDIVEAFIFLTLITFPKFSTLIGNFRNQKLQIMGILQSPGNRMIR